MELLTSLFDRRRTKTSCIFLLTRCGSEGDEYVFAEEAQLYKVCQRAALHKQVVSLIFSSTASCPGWAQQGCE